MKLKLNEQEKFWAGKFGNKYISRNKSNKLKKKITGQPLNIIYIKKNILRIK